MFHGNLQKAKERTKKTVKTGSPIFLFDLHGLTHILLNAFYYYALIKDASVRSERNYTHPADEILLT